MILLGSLAQITAAAVLLILLAPATLPLLTGFQLAFVAVPFVAAGLGRWRDAGPFQPRQWTLDRRTPNTLPPDVLEPRL